MREIVCESLRFSDPVKSATLMAELDPADIVQKQTRAIYEHFIRDELYCFEADADIRRDGWWYAFGKELVDDVHERAEKRREEERRLANEAAKPKDGKADGTDPPLPIAIDADNRRAVALYCCLFTDLRRAWHAVRIHEAAPSLQPDDDESATHASLAALTNRDRMPLYTRQQIRALLERSKWTKSVLEVFAKEHVVDRVGTKFEAQAKAQAKARKLKYKKGIEIENVWRLFAASKIDVAPPAGSAEVLLQKAQQLDEKADFHGWTGTLRKIGRAVCDRWPVHDDEQLDPLESLMFGDDLEEIASGVGGGPSQSSARIHIFREWVDEVKKEQGEKRLRTQRSNARQARKLVWLLHGLAPSLPAIIHSEIMGMIYQVSLLEKAAESSKFIDEAKTALQSTARKLREDTNVEITAWAELIGTLSVVLRYIKIKALHLDVSFILREAGHSLKDDTLKDNNAEIIRSELRDLLVSCGYEELYKMGQFDIDKVVVGLVNIFEGTKGPDIATKSPMNLELSTFPDVAPSTLFGERWVNDILARNGLKNELIIRVPSTLERDYKTQNDSALDSGISVNGVFGETEQWLWTANRGLRKLRAVLHDKLGPDKKPVWEKEFPEPVPPASERNSSRM